MTAITKVSFPFTLVTIVLCEETLTVQMGDEWGEKKTSSDSDANIYQHM